MTSVKQNAINLGDTPEILSQNFQLISKFIRINGFDKSDEDSLKFLVCNRSEGTNMFMFYAALEILQKTRGAEAFGFAYHASNITNEELIMSADWKSLDFACSLLGRIVRMADDKLKDLLDIVSLFNNLNALLNDLNDGMINNTLTGSHTFSLVDVDNNIRRLELVIGSLSVRDSGPLFAIDSVKIKTIFEQTTVSGIPSVPCNMSKGFLGILDDKILPQLISADPNGLFALLQEVMIAQQLAVRVYETTSFRIPSEDQLNPEVDREFVEYYRIKHMLNIVRESRYVVSKRRVASQIRGYVLSKDSNSVSLLLKQNDLAVCAKRSYFEGKYSDHDIQYFLQLPDESVQGNPFIISSDGGTEGGITLRNNVEKLPSPLQTASRIVYDLSSSAFAVVVDVMSAANAIFGVHSAQAMVPLIGPVSAEAIATATAAASLFSPGNTDRDNAAELSFRSTEKSKNLGVCIAPHEYDPSIHGGSLSSTNTNDLIGKLIYGTNPQDIRRESNGVIRIHTNLMGGDRAARECFENITRAPIPSAVHELMVTMTDGRTVYYRRSDKSGLPKVEINGMYTEMKLYEKITFAR